MLLHLCARFQFRSLEETYLYLFMIKKSVERVFYKHYESNLPVARFLCAYKYSIKDDFFAFRMNCLFDNDNKGKI